MHLPDWVRSMVGAVAQLIRVRVALRPVSVAALAAAGLLALPFTAAAAPKFNLVAGSGTWISGNGFGTPTFHVNANDKAGQDAVVGQFTADYAEGYLIQGPIKCFHIVVATDGTKTAYLVAQLNKEQGTDPYNVAIDPTVDRYKVGQYVYSVVQLTPQGTIMFNFSRGSDVLNCDDSTSRPELPLTDAAFTISPAS